MQQTVIEPQLDFGEALKQSTDKIFQCKGRARRSEYWWTMLVVYLVTFFLTPFIGGILALLTIPLTIRRLHDTGKSGWWYIPILILKGAFLIFFLVDIITMIISVASTNPDIMLASFTYFITKYVLFFVLISVYNIVLIIFLCMDSDQGTNKYGESPKYKTIEVADN